MANVHDSKMMLATVEAVEPVRAKTRGRPRRRPHEPHADKSYDYRHLRPALRKRRIIPRIARCGVEPKAMSESSDYSVFKGPATL